MRTSWHCWRCRVQGVVSHRIDHRPEVVRRLILRSHAARKSSSPSEPAARCRAKWQDIATVRDVVGP